MLSFVPHASESTPSHWSIMKAQLTASNFCPKPGLKFFKFENLISVQTLTTINATKILQCLYLRNVINKGRIDSCYCWK